MSDRRYVAAKGIQCPVCEGADLESGTITVDHGIATQTVRCLSCNAEWSDVYRLIGYWMAQEPKETKMTFRPDHQNEDSSWTNRDRTEHAACALDAYNTSRDDTDTLETDVIDLIADLGHLCDARDVDFEAVLRMAKENWEAER